ncbi:MAG: hypothetical protein C0485_09935 [Pirellula sp.]|nr:hypothetical protein [Pirellula sp.]
MDNYPELARRCEALEQRIALSLRIEELERQLLRRSFQKMLKRRKRWRIEQLQLMAEADRIHAAAAKLIDAPG